MQIRKINDVYFPERGKIDKAQFILDRSGLVLKICKIPTASLNCKMLHFFSLSFSEAALGMECASSQTDAPLNANRKCK